MNRVLVVDDEPGMRAALRANFLQHGWGVGTASGAADAMAAFRRGCHPLVVTDIRMPDGDGFAVMHAVRALAPSTAVILLTAFSTIPDATPARFHLRRLLEPFWTQGGSAVTRRDSRAGSGAVVGNGALTTQEYGGDDETTMSKVDEAYTAWQGKDERERILMEQLPEVRYIARRIHERLPRHVPIEDLVHAGVLGLIDALQKFDRSKQVQFSSYARFRIRGAILDSLREMDWSPRELRRKARRLGEAHNKLSGELGRLPTETEMAAELGMSLADFQHLLGELDGLEIGSLRVQSSFNGQEQDLCEYLPNAPEDTPFHQCLRSEMKQLLARVIAELPDRERQVLALYYFEELTMKEVGAVLGIGESRVSQIHSLAMVRLRSRLQGLIGAEHAQARAATSGV